MPWTPPGVGPGFIYVLEAGGRHKIGYSTRPSDRATDIATSSPYPVECLGWVEGSREDEARWHQQFSHKRVHREWFELSSHDIALILRDAEHVHDDPDDPAYWEPC